MQGSERTRTVKKNIFASILIKGFSIVISLLLVPMTLGYVSSELYGIWLTLSSIMVWLGFFDIGFTLGLKNKLAEAIAVGDYQRGKSLVSTTYFLMIAIFLPLCLILEVLTPTVNWSGFLNVNAIYNTQIAQAIRVLLAFFCMQMVVNVLGTVIAAFQQVALSSSFTVIGNFLSLIAIWLLTKFCPPSLISLAFAISAMPVLVLIIASVIFYSGRYKSVAPSVKSIDLSYVKDLFQLGAKFFLIQIQMVVLYQSTNILISNVSGPEDVTAYNIAYKYLSVSLMVYGIILAPLWPAFTDAYTKKDFTWMNNVYRKMQRVYAASVVILILMAAVSPIVYKLWIGSKADIPLAMTIIVCIYMIINSWDSLQVMLINGTGKIQLQSYVTIIGLVMHIPMSLFLGKYLGFGAIGVVLSVIIVNIIYSTFFTIQIRKILSQSASGIWIK